MFLCEECHKREKCNLGFMHLPSYGKCETCGKTTICLDCHNY